MEMFTNGLVPNMARMMFKGEREPIRKMFNTFLAERPVFERDQSKRAMRLFVDGRSYNSEGLGA